jgi:lysophospholipase L1-like esterase
MPGGISNMSRSFIFLTLTALLAACAPGVDNAPVAEPAPTLSQTATPMLAIPSATLIPQSTATIIPSCKTIKIMPLGDSITYGEGIIDYGGYRNLLGALLESDGYLFDFVGSQRSAENTLSDADNEGHSGWRISDIKSGIDSEGWLEIYQPDVILLHIGTNDLVGSDDLYGNLAYASGDLSDLLDDILARLPETRVIVAQIIRTRWGSDAKHRFYNDAIPDVVASKGSRVSMVDMQDVLSKNDFTTLLHPSPKGYDKMAHAWESAISMLDLEKCAAP